MRHLLPAGLFCLIALPLSAEENFDFFEKNIRPVLAEKCYACHSAGAKAPMGGLAVDTKEGLLRGGKSGAPAVVPGKPEDSLLLRALEHTTKDLKMPPGRPLPAEQVRAFAEWIKMGAPDPRGGRAALAEKPAYDWDKERKHWAYQPLRAVDAPAEKDPEWNRTLVDRFLRARMREKALQPMAKASKAAIFRRVTYSLTGLPPTSEEIDAFLADTSANALETVVDRLLASPAYGEHWGRHWLDVVRYSDTAGDASDFPVPEMFRYRNYVIRAFQDDKPYDVFLREQIAGDTMPFANAEDRRDKLIATGYLANARRFGQTMNEFHLTVDDTIENLSKSVLGLTVGCARCHDHKFDPIPTKDYYALAGIFNSSNYSHAGLEHHQYLEHYRAINEKDQERLDKLQEKLTANYRIVKTGAKLKTSQDPLERLKFFEAQAEVELARRTWPELPMIYGVSEGAPKNARIMVKGEPKALGPEVPRGFLTILGGQQLPVNAVGSGRAQLAEWITDTKNPLTARVIVNRVWLWHFGRGLVNSPNDFGTRGERPTHPELLDTLAARFMQQGWSIKKLHKEIVLARAFQTASAHLAANFDKDPKNEFYWKFDRRRLTAEELRDTLLAVTGDLDRLPGQQHPFPPRASYVFTQHRPFVGDIDKFDTNKRTVYLLQQRIRRHPFLELFDGADTNASTPARAANNTAVQALYFMNNDFVFRRAESLAAQVAWAGPSNAERLRHAYRQLYGRTPSPAEIQKATAHLASAAPAKDAWTGLLRAMMASNEFLFID
jgi:hypothetical protein